MASYEQWQSQIFKKIAFSPHLAPLKGPNEAKSEFSPKLHHIQGTGTLLKVVNKDKVYLRSAQLPSYVLGIGLFCY